MGGFKPQKVNEINKIEFNPPPFWSYAHFSNIHCYKLLLLLFIYTCQQYVFLKGIVHFEIKIWYLSAYPKGIQDVGVFFSSVDPILMFLGQTVLVCQSYNGRYRSLSL